MQFFFTPVLIRLIYLSSKDNTVASAFQTATSRNAKSNPNSARNGVSLSLASRCMTHLYDSYLFESGWSSGGDGGRRSGRLPRGNPSSANARASARDYKANVKQRSARLAGQSHDPPFFSVFLDHAQNERRGNISFFSLCDVHREFLPFFLFYRSLTDMLPRGVTDRFVLKSGTILADFSHLLVTIAVAGCLWWMYFYLSHGVIGEILRIRRDERNDMLLLSHKCRTKL